MIILYFLSQGVIKELQMERLGSQEKHFFYSKKLAFRFLYWFSSQSLRHLKGPYIHHHQFLSHYCNNPFYLWPSVLSFLECFHRQIGKKDWVFFNEIVWQNKYRTFAFYFLYDTMNLPKFFLYYFQNFSYFRLPSLVSISEQQSLHKPSFWRFFQRT